MGKFRKASGLEEPGISMDEKVQPVGCEGRVPKVWKCERVARRHGRYYGLGVRLTRGGLVMVNLKVVLTGLTDAQEMSRVVRDVTQRAALESWQIQSLDLAIPLTSWKFTCKTMESGYQPPSPL